MIEQEMIAQIQQKPLMERIQFIEVILQSLKQDVKKVLPGASFQRKPFSVRTFRLGNEVRCDREEIYAERR